MLNFKAMLSLAKSSLVIAGIFVTAVNEVLSSFFLTVIALFQVPTFETQSTTFKSLFKNYSGLFLMVYYVLYLRIYYG